MSDPLIPSGSLLTFDPFRCRVWDLNDRIEGYVTEATCRAEIDSIARAGQLVPVIGRPIRSDPAFDIEVICGTRRLFVARYLKIPLRVEVRELTDRQAAIAIETENFVRRQASSYERGLWVAKLLKRSLYRSQEEIARELRIPSTRLTRLLKFAELPTTVLGAFSSPHDILESWAVELHKAWNDERRRILVERSRVLEKRLPRPPAISVYEFLLAPQSATARNSRRGVGRLIKNPAGEPLFRVERQREEVIFRFHTSLVNTKIEIAITEAVISTLVSSCDSRAATAA